MGLIATGIALVALWAPPDPEVVRAALKTVLAERPYQTTLPDAPPFVPGGGSARDSAATGERTSDRTSVRDPNGDPVTVRVSPERRRHRTGRTADRRDPDLTSRDRSSSHKSTGGGGGAAIFWVIVSVLGVLAVLWLVSEWTGREKKAVLATARANAPPVPTMPIVPLDEVDALAAAGRYGEAIHLLLLRTIAALAKSASSLVPSLTSREVLGAVPFRAGARDVLAGLVDAVEVSLFGGRAVAESAYLDCRARFDRFKALQSGAPT